MPDTLSPAEPKKSGSKMRAIIAGLVLLFIFPVIGYYVVQKTNITNYLPFAAKNYELTVDKVKSGSKYTKTDTKSDTTNAVFIQKEEVDKGNTFVRNQERGASTPTPIPTATPTPVLTNTPTVTPTGSPQPTLTNTPTPTNPLIPTSPPPEPGRCDASCGSDSNCQSGLICASVDGVKRCRNPECTSELSCTCPRVVIVTATPMPEGKEIVKQVVVTATPLPVPKTPVAGIPSVLGAATVVGGILLLVLGLIL